MSLRPLMAAVGLLVCAAGAGPLLAQAPSSSGGSWRKRASFAMAGQEGENCEKRERSFHTRGTP